MTLGPLDNRPWDFKKLRLLIDQAYDEEYRLDRKTYWLEYDSDGYLGERLAALDSGQPERVLDAVQLDSAVSKIEDLPVRAALILRMHGLAPEAIGSVLRDRSKRSARRLIADGVRMVREIEARRYAEFREDL